VDPSLIQRKLATRFEGDYTRAARMHHFMNMLRAALDGMASIGVVIQVEVNGVDEEPLGPPAPGPLESLETAIAHMAGGSHGR
jgi:hypothetical protein